MHRRLPAAVKLQLPDWKTPLRTDKVYPLELGRFTIRGVVKTDSPDDWLLAYDQNLEREVWIHWLSQGTPPPAETRQPDSSSVRMRVIESGLDQGRHWDAFLAPPGVPLGAFVQTGGYLPWPIVGQLIASVLSGAYALRRGMSDRWWHTGRHWIDAAGRLTIAEFHWSPTSFPILFRMTPKRPTDCSAIGAGLVAIPTQVTCPVSM